MKKAVAFFYDYLIGELSDNDVVADEVKLPDGETLCETGPEIIAKVTSLIALRRPVLLTGSRGCGKSYCALRGALEAERANIIGGNRFLQGNRELPREYLSEDGLVIESGKAVTIPALAMTPIDAEPGFTDIYSVTKPPAYEQWLKDQKLKPENFPWPAMPSSIVDSNLDGDGTKDPRSRFWSPKDWWVLFLDEVNRFGDGFLDGLLSLAEEGKIVRRGQTFYVPVVLVCTANPPGYDITAKRLSPPLQSRIAASYRIGQPSLEVLNMIILEDRLRQIRAKNPNVQIVSDSPTQPIANGAPLYIIIPQETRVLACAYLLSLWCDPGVVMRPKGKVTKGIYYLLPQTRWDMHELLTASNSVAKQRRTLLNALDELGALAEYGPDARAIGDWFALVIQNIIIRHSITPSNKSVTLGKEHLRLECVSVLGKKIRENYNEAADPDKDQTKDKLLLEIFDIIYGGPATEDIRRLIYRNRQEIIQASGPRSKEMERHLAQIDPRWRSRLIETVLDLRSRAPSLVTSPSAWEGWRTFSSKTGSLPGIMIDGCFRTPQARHWVAQTLLLAPSQANNSLAQYIMLLPCMNNQVNLEMFVAAAKGDEIARKQITSFEFPKVTINLNEKQTTTLVRHVQRLYQASNLPRSKKQPERAIALALGFADFLVSHQAPLEEKHIDKAVEWYLGWFLQEAVPDATPEQDLIQPFAGARPLKPVLLEALSVADAVIDILSIDSNAYWQNPQAVKERLRRAPDAIVNIIAAKARRQKYPFNVAGFNC